MISNIEEAVLAIQNSKYNKAIITEKREGFIGEEHLYGFYMTNNQAFSYGQIDPFGFGLLVSEKGTIDCLSDTMSMSLLDILHKAQ